MVFVILFISSRLRRLIGDGRGGGSPVPIASTSLVWLTCLSCILSHWTEWKVGAKQGKRLSNRR